MNIVDYLGNYHPLLVHLPIGVLSLFLLLAIFISRVQLQKSSSIIRFLLLISALTATGSSITGLITASGGGYDSELVTGHQVMGLVLTIVNWALWYKTDFLFQCSMQIYRLLMGLIAVLMTLTGHAGGSLTHGPEFLVPPPISEWFKSETYDRNPITMESSAFEAASAIFQAKCMVCHGRNKQKGKLRLDGKEHILAGGENGQVISENATNSLLIHRLLLPIDDEDHMPPKERKQLSKVEIDFLIWWIDNGLDFDNSLSEMNLPDSLSDILSSEEVLVENPLIPERDVAPVATHVVEGLQSFGLIVIPISGSSNYVSVSFANVLPENSNKAVRSLIDVKDQLIWLNLDYQNLDQQSWNEIGNLTNLRKLNLRSSNLDDNSIRAINKLTDIVLLNLVETKITAAGVATFENLKNLKSMFLFRTGISSSEIDEIVKMFPEVTIEYGNYTVPILESDTTVLTKQNK